MSRKLYDKSYKNVEESQSRKMSGNKRCKRKHRKPKNKRQEFIGKTKENTVYHEPLAENVERTPSEISKYNELTGDISKKNKISNVKKTHQIKTNKFSNDEMIKNACPKWSTKFSKQIFNEVRMNNVSHSSNDFTKYSVSVNHKGTFYHKKAIKRWKNKYRLAEIELSNEHQIKNLHDLDKTKQYLNIRLSKYPKLSENRRSSTDCITLTKQMEIDDKFKNAFNNQEQQLNIIRPSNTTDIGTQWDHMFSYCYNKPHKQNDELQTSNKHILENKTVCVQPKENIREQCRYDYDILRCNSSTTKHNNYYDHVTDQEYDTSSNIFPEERETCNTFTWFNGLVDHCNLRSIKNRRNCSLKAGEKQNEFNCSKNIILQSGDKNTRCNDYHGWKHKDLNYQDTNWTFRCMPNAKNDEQTYTTQCLRMTCDHDFSSYDLSLETDKIYPLNTKWKFSDRTNVCRATEKCLKSSEMLKTESDLGCYEEYFDKMWENIVQGISGYDIC